MDKKKVVILATEGLTTNLLYNELSNHFEITRVIIENKTSKKVILKNRIKRLGVFKVLGQVLFVLIVAPILSLRSKKKIKQIISDNNVNAESIPLSKIKNIESINNSDTIDLIQSSKPDLIFVNGTRIILKSIIESVNIKMINIHVGITPKYRGVHGGYWAVYNKDLNLFGTTLHWLDAGVDTGNIIGQKVFGISKKDNFMTYPIKQYIIGLTLIRENLKNINEGVAFSSLTKESQLYYHPTIIQYLYNRLFNKVK